MPGLIGLIAWQKENVFLCDVSPQLQLSAVKTPPAVLIPIDSQSDGSWPMTQQQPAHDLMWTIQGVGSDQE